jgi:uncharacterized UPF0146 family protein
MTDRKKELPDLHKQQKEEQNQKAKHGDVTAIEIKKKESKEFLCTVVDSAFHDLAKELYKQERKAYNFGSSEISRELEVRFQDSVEFRYIVNVLVGTTPTTVQASYIVRYQNGNEEQGGGTIMKNDTQADIAEITKDDIISDFMKYYIGCETPCPY